MKLDNTTVVVNQRDDLKVNCEWTPGNPPFVGRLYSYNKHENRRLLASSAVGGDTSLSKNLNTVQCSDSGIYSCQVGDVSVNKTLLVQCQPIVLAPTEPFTFYAGESAHLEFSVQSYTRELTGCRLEAVSQSILNKNGRAENCTSSLTVTGSPPDLTVRLRLDNVSIQDHGKWRLHLTNDVGTGESAVFSLKVLDPLNGVPETQNCVPTTIIIVVANVAVVVVVVVIGVAVNIVCWRKGRCQTRRQQQPPAEIILDVMPSPGHRDPELRAAHAQSNQNETPYDEVLEDRLPNEAGVHSEPYSNVPSNLVTGQDGYLAPTLKQRSPDRNRPITSPVVQNPNDQKQPITSSATKNPPRDSISPIASPSDWHGEAVQENSADEAAGQYSNFATYTPLLLSQPAEPGVYSALIKKSSPALALDEERKPSSRPV